MGAEPYSSIVCCSTQPRERVRTFPCAGVGVHRWMFLTACRLRRQVCRGNMIAGRETGRRVGR